MKRFYATLWAAFEVIAIAFLPLFVVHQFLARPFIVQGASMEPNFQDGNYLVVDVASYKLGDVHRGDVVVFHYPGNRALYYIKRVVGLPGDSVSFDGGKIFINNKELEEAYLPSNLETTSPKREFDLGKDQYFVMGDNRNASFDSRSWGPVSKSDIVGAVKLRVWPPLEFYGAK